MSSWRLVRIGDILKVKSGRNQKEVECPDGQYQILGTGGEIGRTNAFLCNKPSVLIGRKGTINKPMYKDEPFWTVDTLFYTEIKSDFLPKYVYYLFKTINWLRYNEASGVPSLSSSTIERIKIKIPNLDTRQKIVQILDAWADSIEDLKRYKEVEERLFLGLCRKLLTKKYEGAKQIKLSGLVDCLKGSGLSKDMLVENGEPCILYGELYTKYDYSIRDIISRVPRGTSGVRSKAGDILVPASTTTNGRDLAIASTVKESGVLLGGDINILRAKDGAAINSEYLALYLRYAKWREIASRTQGITIIHLYGKELLSVSAELPSLAEQDKIVSIINLQKEKIEKLELSLGELKKQYKYLLNHLMDGDFDLSGIQLEEKD